MKAVRFSRQGPEYSAALKAWRAQMGWTQQEAADALGMHRVNLGRMECGMYPVQRVTLLACSALAAGLDELAPE